MNGPVKPDVIYGNDDRLELYQVPDAKFKKLVSSTVALMKSDNLIDQQNGEFKIEGRNFGDSYHLCSSEPFGEQDTAAFCSGFLVAPDTVVTAGHCISDDRDCRDVRFVFGYALQSPGALPTSTKENNIYLCSSVIHSEVNMQGADFAVVKLDRAVQGYQPLQLRRSGAINPDTSVVVAGYPVGLPLKIAGGAKVRSNSNPGFFVANLDTYGGNSGSAVFNAATFEVEGVLVRGEEDFEYNGTCASSNRCTDIGCRGEDVTRITQVLPYVTGNRRH
jgi:V8-like Glu-specific endopeptidase